MKAIDKLIKDYEQHCQKIAQSTSIDINESIAEKSKRKKRLESNYINWFEYHFPQYAKSPCAKYHKKMAKIIDDNDILDFLAEIFRSGAKSVHLDMGIPLWLYVRGKLKFMLLVGETDPKAKKLISDIQSQLQYNQRFINDYGRKFKYGDWADGDFTTTDGTKFVSMSIGQSVRGIREGAERPDYIVIDDVDTKKRCNNERLSREAYEWVWEDLKGCFDEGAKRQRFVVANNNFHKNTIINQLKTEFNRINKETKERGDKQTHFVLSVNAVKDVVNFEPSWPEKTDSEYWRIKFHKTPYRSFMREYMHTHIQEGAIFKNKQIQKTKILRLDQYDALCLYGDLSYKDNADYKAMILVGKKGKDFHIIDAFVRQSSRANAASWLYDTYEKYKLQNFAVSYLIEGLFAMDDFVSDFDAEGDRRGYYIPVVADKKSKANKFDRIESMSGYFERMNVFFNDKLMQTADFIALIEQILVFEKGSGAHDDAPDALQSAIAKLNNVCRVENFKARIKSRSTKRRKNRF
ncbi:MAG: phage terminase large subunit [Marinifilaceae bacterium]|jgi:predicted phage terminase large subunit-like protein|nr:phage terminase large subunit [Marinifilaceae bacterium]